MLQPAIEPGLYPITQHNCHCNCQDINEASSFQAPCHALVGDSRLMHPVARHLRNEDVVPDQWPCCAAQQYLGFAFLFATDCLATI